MHWRVLALRVRSTTYRERVMNLALTEYVDTDEAVLNCEAAIFARTYGDTRDHLDEFYRGYEQQTCFLSLTDDSGRVVGVARLVRP